MDYLKLPKLNFTGLFIAIALGVSVAVAFYQAQIRGLIPANLSLPKTSNAPIQTQRVVQEENAIISVVDKTSPSVVAISATLNRAILNPFDPFSAPRANQSSTIGTGFVVSDKGIIVTNKHVLSDPSLRYTVITKDGNKYEIRKIYRDPILDLGIVQIDATSLQALELGDSSKVKVGQTVIAIGNALGKFTNTVTSGIISGLGRRVVAGDPFQGSAESLDDLIQTDAAINPGNSGGPLLNSSGQVIGVNVATTEGAQGISFAIPINSVKKIADEFISKGSVSRPFLGIQYKFISKDVAILYEYPQGAYIQDVVENSAAFKAGVRISDIITKIDDQIVDSDSKISGIIAGKEIGDQVKLHIWNNGVESDVVATLQELPSQ